MSRAEQAVRLALARGGVAKARRDRSAFGYMEPDPDIPDFAQCGSCASWLSDRVRCHWFSDKFKVLADASCILYVEGEPIDGATAKPANLLDPKVVGFITGKTRCENCVSADKERWVCKLFDVLNERFPTTFRLNIEIKARACCNAFMGSVD